MMTKRLYIDGKDAYKSWGVYVTEQGWNELIAFPPLKEVEYNDWQEEDGIEADLSNPQLNTREVSIQFAYSGLYSRFLDFIAHIADTAYHDFECAYIKRRYKLRITQMPNLTAQKDIGRFSIKFADDFPLYWYKYAAPQSQAMKSEDYLVDGVAFTDYGCRILKGTLSEVMKTPAAKTNLLRNIATLTGATYDGAFVTLKEKDVNLNCLMRAETLDELWRNYDALLFDLTRPNERMLKVAALEQTFPFFYKKATVSQFYPTDKIWLRFNITLTFTRDFRLKKKPKAIRLTTPVSIRLTANGRIRKVNN